MASRDPVAQWSRELADLLAPVRALCGAGARWKDADLLLRSAMPHELVRHRHAFCRSRQSQRYAGACQRDCVLDAAWWRRRGDRGQFRRCHAGVVEWIQPVFLEEAFAGTLSIGPWRDERSPPDAADLPPLDRAAAGHAAALVAQGLRLLAELRRSALAGVELQQRHHPLAAAALASLAREPRIDRRLDHLAAGLGCHPEHCSRRLKAATGRGFSALREELVMQRARRLLGDPHASIGAIAAELGYRHATHFTKAFRRHSGLTPAAYRKRQPGEAP